MQRNHLIIIAFIIIIPLLYLYYLLPVNGLTKPGNIYTVKTGNNLKTIALQFNTTVQEIKLLNKLQSNKLRAGQKIMIPITYTVKSGDTLAKIASVYNIPVHQIKITNGLKSDSLLVGQKLHISCKKQQCALEEKFIKAGLVDIQSIDPTIKVNLMYSSAHNFLGSDLYGCLEKGYLYKDAAVKLAKAQKTLKVQKPGYSLLVYDCTRPLNVQRKMWHAVENTYKHIYIANPAKGGSMHNYGAAVDLTIIDDHGVPLDMGTPVDYFAKLSHPCLEQKYLAQGKLTKQQVANRKLLRSIMIKSGFEGISVEWWHFDAFPLNWVRENLKIIQ